MNAVLIAWVASMAFCSLYTLILPTWDAYVDRRDARLRMNPQTVENQAATFSLGRKTKSAA